MDFNGQTQVSGKIKKHALLTHLIYDLATKSRWAPFIGVGIGFARINSTDMKYDYTVVYSNGTSVSGTRTEPGGKGNTFAYQGKIGVNYLLSKRSALYLSANYFNITRTDLGGGTIYEGFNITSIKAGLLLNIKN
jgi:opacity protein-like surface antigen